MLTRCQLTLLVVLCGLTIRPALGTPEGSPELLRRAKLAIELQRAIAEHEITSQKAVEATIAAYLAGDGVTLSDVLLAMDDYLESGLALDPRMQSIASYLTPRGSLPEPRATTRQRVAAAREKHLERCKRLEAQVLALRNAGQKSDAAAKRIKAYRQSAEIVVACRAMWGSPGAEIEAELRDTPVDLLIQRAASEREASEAILDAFASSGDASLGDVLIALSARLHAELVLARSREDKLAAYQRHLARCKKLEAQIVALHTAGQFGADTELRFESYRLLAEINVALATAYSTGNPDRAALKALAGQRLLSTRRAVEATGKAFATGGDVPLADMLLAIRARFEAESSSLNKPEEFSAASGNYIASAKSLEATIATLIDVGKRGPQAALRAKAQRENVEMTLIEMQLNGPLP